MSRRILVVDDNISIHHDFEKILRAARDRRQADALEAALFGGGGPAAPGVEFQLEAASSGPAAVALVERSIAEGRPYRVAFVDVRFPIGWDGIEITERLWAVDGRVQVVLCTAYSDHSWEQIAARLGTSDRLLILRKPFDNIEVRQLATALSAKWTLAEENRRHIEELDQRIAAATSKRVELERQLLHAQRLESLGRMVASIGHEINNPLSFVTANLKLARQSLAELGDPAAASIRELLDDACQGSERIAQIVRDVKVFAHVRGQETDVVEPRAVAESALRLVQNQLRHRAGVTVELAGLPLIAVERGRLEQVFVNLLVNAMDALPEGSGGSVTIRGRAEGGFVHIEVGDSGCGIAPEHLDRVFEPFYTTKAVGSGTGLGLPICKAIVDAHGGRISIESAVGRGTTVHVVLPVAEALPTPVKEGVAEPTPVPPGKHILLIDDEPKILATLQRTLTGYATIAAASGGEALERCRTASFDLILCDLMMPGLSGVELFQRLEASGSEQAQRIVFMSGGVFDERMRKALAGCGRPCIDKPFDPTALRALVARHLGG